MVLQVDRQASAWRAYVTVPPTSGTLPGVYSCMYLLPQPSVTSPFIGRKFRTVLAFILKIYLLFFENLFLLKNWPWLLDSYFFQSIKTVLELSTQSLCSDRPGFDCFYYFTPQCVTWVSTLICEVRIMISLPSIGWTLNKYGKDKRKTVEMWS